MNKIIIIFLKNKYLIFLISFLFLNINAAEKAEILENPSQIVQLDFGNNKIVSLEKKLAIKSNRLRHALDNENSDVIRVCKEAEHYYEIFNNVILKILKNKFNFYPNEISINEVVDLTNAIDYFEIDYLLTGYFRNYVLEYLANNLICKFKISHQDENYVLKINQIFEKIILSIEEIKNIELKEEIKYKCLIALLSHQIRELNHLYYDFVNQELFEELNKDINISINNQNDTILIMATCWEDLPLVKFLIYLNADKTIKNKSGHTALNYSQSGRTNTVINEIERLLTN